MTSLVVILVGFYPSPIELSTSSSSPVSSLLDEAEIQKDSILIDW